MTIYGKLIPDTNIQTLQRLKLESRLELNMDRINNCIKKKPQLIMLELRQSNDYVKSNVTWARPLQRVKE